MMQKFYINCRDLAIALGRDKARTYNLDLAHLMDSIRLDNNDTYPDMLVCSNNESVYEHYISESYIDYIITPTVDIPDLQRYTEKLTRELCRELQGKVKTLEALNSEYSSVSKIAEDDLSGDEDEETAADAAKAFTEKANEPIVAPKPKSHGKKEGERVETMEDVDKAMQEALDVLNKSKEISESPIGELTDRNVPKSTVVPKKPSAPPKTVSTDLSNPFDPHNKPNDTVGQTLSEPTISQQQEKPVEPVEKKIETVAEINSEPEPEPEPEKHKVLPFTQRKIPPKKTSHDIDFEKMANENRASMEKLIDLASFRTEKEAIDENRNESLEGLLRCVINSLVVDVLQMDNRAEKLTIMKSIRSGGKTLKKIADLYLGNLKRKS